MTGGWFCHDCETEAASLPAARRHAKEAGPVYRGSRMVSHKLTQDEGAAKADRPGHTHTGFEAGAL